VGEPKLSPAADIGSVVDFFTVAKL